jgi:hypothetical protein
MPIYAGTGLGGLFGSTGTTSSTSGHWVVPALATSLTSPYQAMANQTAATSAYNTQEIWVTPTEYYALAQARVGIFRAYTAEQQAQAAAAQAEAYRRHAEWSERQAQARTRSRELLLAHLTEAQRKTFRDNRWFVIQGGKTKATYRIRDAGHAGNIDVMQGERVTHRLCCHCDHSIPVYDNMLAQKLTLECDEEAFLRLANRHAA